MPSFTVLIPAHDAGGTLDRTLASVMDQSVAADAVLVVDDASRDDTRAVASRWPGVEIIPGPGRGVAAARNAGLSYACTTHVALLDADDRWHPRFLERAQELLSAEPAAAAIFLSATAVGDDGHTIAEHALPERRVALKELLLGRIVPTTSATVLNRQVALDSGGFSEGLECAAGVEDLDVWFRLAQHGICVTGATSSADYVVHQERDRGRSRKDLAALERDRERVVELLAKRGVEPRLARRATAIMRARTGRYWLIAGFSPEARRIAWRSLRARPTIEGVLTIMATYVSPGLRERARLARRRWLLAR